MKILVDENVPFAELLFSELGEVSTKPGRAISAQDIAACEALIVRSVTRVDKNLLAGSNVKFVGTCTIGVDHVDSSYLGSQGIAFHSAPGCNANSVVQYVMSVLVALNRFHSSQKVAVVGCGNVGGRVYRQLKNLGFSCVGIDPHLSQKDIPDLEPFEAIYDADIVCMHTPLVKQGPFPTLSLLGESELRRLKKNALLINAGRGECIDNAALYQILSEGQALQCALDVWAGEPDINAALFPLLSLGSPHIAGYSFEGKVNGSLMIFSRLAEYLGCTPEWIEQHLAGAAKKVFGEPEALNLANLEAAIVHAYDVREDHHRLAEVLSGLPSSFDALRKNYPMRREFSHYQLSKNFSQQSMPSAQILGFHFAD